MRKKKVYTVATVVWFCLVFAVGIAVLGGVTEPFVSTSELPEQELSVFVAMIVLAVAGGTATTYLGRRAWTAAGRSAGLTPEGGGLVGDRSDFTGTVRGRSVDVWTYEESTGHGEHKETHRYVVFEAALTRPLEDGFAVTVATAESDSIAVNALPEPTVAEDPTFQGVGPTADRYADSVLSGQSLDALGALRSFGTFAVGDASGALVDALPDSVQSLLGSIPGTDAAADLERRGHADASTVSHTVEGLIFEADEFERQVEAVVAVADAVEAA